MTHLVDQNPRNPDRHNPAQRNPAGFPALDRLRPARPECHCHFIRCLFKKPVVGFTNFIPWSAGLLLASLVLTASGAGPSPSLLDLTVHDLAQRVDHHYNQLHTLKAVFSESYVGMGISRTESGTLFLLKPGRMKWEYSVPPGKLFLLDGKYAWFYARGDAQVQRIPAKELDDLRSPLRFLLGHTELEKELEHLRMTPAPNGQFTLTGQPKGQQKRVRRLTLTVTPEGAITAIEIEETDGALTHFTFKGEQPNAPIPPEAFHFNPPPGIPVVDTMPPV
jgi:outer membrane lipoprotein carrier protein